MSGTVEDVIAQARELLERVEYDDHGVIVAGLWRAGNGGLLSCETIRAAGLLRQALETHEAAARREGGS